MKYGDERMKFKIFALTFLLILSLFALISCKDDTCTIIFDSNGGSPVKSQTVGIGGKLQDPGVPTIEGDYDFEGWFRGDELWDFDEDTVSYNFTLTAQWTKLYDVTFDSDNGSQPTTVQAKEGGLVPKPQDPTRSGYFFDGWYRENLIWSFNENIVTEAVTLKAKWVKAVTVTFDSDGGSDIDPVTLREGQGLAAPTPPTKEDHQFLGWFIGDEPWDFESGVFTENATLTAHWKNATTYKVTFDSDGAQHVTPQYIVHGEKAHMPSPSPSKTGYDFVCWKLGDTEWNFDEDTVTENITLTAIWVEVNPDDNTQLWGPTHVFSYTITFDSAGGTVYKQENYPAGKSLYESGVMLPKPEKEGYVFAGWYLNGTRFDENTTLNENILIVARWGYAVEFTDTNEGGEEYTVMSSVVLPDSRITAPELDGKAGKTFDGWYIDGTDTKWNFDTDTVSKGNTENGKIVLKARWRDN